MIGRIGCVTLRIARTHHHDRCGAGCGSQVGQAAIVADVTHCTRRQRRDLRESQFANPLDHWSIQLFRDRFHDVIVVRSAQQDQGRLSRGGYCVQQGGELRRRVSLACHGHAGIFASARMRPR